MATKKIFRKDLLIENLRKTLLNDVDSCYWCPIKESCQGGDLLCFEDKAEDFTQAIIDRFSTEVEAIDNMPTVEPKRNTGKWILHENQRQEDVDNGNYLYVCSECGKSDIHAKTQEVPFCWWCGSEMREEHYD